jgi:RHS repeat-associated protein
MPGWSSKPGRRRRPILTRTRLRVAAAVTAGSVSLLVLAPVAVAAPAVVSRAVPPVTMHGYTNGPGEHDGTAAGKPHYVPASATQAGTVTGHPKGHQAPAPDLAPPPVGSRTLVTTGSATMAPVHIVTGQGSSDTGSTQPDASPSAAPSDSASPSAPASTPSPSPSATSPASTPAALTAYMSGGTDGASYVVASTYDTVPMANQSGRIAVTLTNSGTSTWSGYGLAALVFPSGDTTGTGTPITTGPTVAISDTITPGSNTTVESVTPAENPGSYEICFDAVNAAGTLFSAEGATEVCAPYTIQQFAPQINEQEPLPGADVDSQTPQLSASAIVPGGFPANPSFTFAFRILNGPNPATATVVASSPWVANNGNSWSPTTNLTWGTTYYWQATVSDAVPPPTSMSGVTWTTPISFVVGDAQASVFNRLGGQYRPDDGDPVMTSDLGGTDYTDSGKTIDPHIGNVAESATDVSVTTTGPPLSIVRTYNSLDPRTSQALGAGWSSMLDMSLAPDPDGSGALILTLYNGQQVRFAKNAAGGYAPPQDLYAVVSALGGGGFAITDQTGTTYQFGQASGTSWLISAITDNNGKSNTFGYSGGTLTTITSTTSGRALHLTWSTPAGATVPHVATITTDPVTAGQPSTALTWTYGYNGNLLHSVCPPGTTTACTNYGYTTSGSHAPTAVLNSNPTSYFRLNDATGSTAAANQIPVNDMTTVDPPATEFNTTLGVPGPVPGVTATSFNGTSSWIPLDGTWCTTSVVSSCKTIPSTGRVNGSSSLGVSMWFKTTATSGILFGLTSAVPSGASTVNEPLLWIASNGHLDGFGGATTTMTSPAAVNNGAWHQAVLIAGSALYVDGVKVATSTTGFSPPSSAMALLGAGTTSNGFTSSWQYFNGSLADVSIYQNDLPSVGTVAAQYAAETTPAAELNSITSPAGRTEFAASYDTVNDRVQSVTDSDGGTWNYSGLVRGASSTAYDSAVMGSSPVDFWPLSDTAGPTALDMTGPSPGTAATPRPPATYANVTLGAAGPDGFSDGTAATFGGTSSQVTIPGGYFAGTGAESAEVWFKTSGSGTLLSSSGGTNGEPMGLAISSGSPKCLEGTVGSTTLDLPVFGTCSVLAGGQVSDGKWHHAILTMSPGLACPSSSFGCSPGSFSQTATLYLDGVQLATANITTQATASATGYTATIGNGSSAGDFTGSIADVSLYTTQLSSSDVTAHYNALKAQVIPTGVTAPTTPPLNTQTVTITDPNGKTSSSVFATGSLVRSVSVLGGVSSFGYDGSRRASTITDPDGNTTYVTHDARNNVTSSTTCTAIGNCQTGYTSYYENLSNALDPRNDKPTDSRDARSSSPSDPTYDTVTAYTATAQIASKTTPATPACPVGCKTSYTYTTGSEPAVGGGTEPSGLLAKTTAPGGGMTTYAYNAAGDVMQTINPAGLVTNYTYDNLGRVLTQTQVSDTFSTGLTTSYTYDGQDRQVTETDPAVNDRVTGNPHAQVTTRTYDADGNTLTTTLSDATGGDPSRTTTNTYNTHGQVASTQDPLGHTTTYTYDALGDKVTQTNPAGLTTAYAYDDTGNLLTTTVDGYTGGDPNNPTAPVNVVEESRAYDPAGLLASVTNAKGTTTAYTYYGNGQVASSYIVCSSCSGGKESVDTYGYDAAGHRVTQTEPGGLVINTAYNADGQVTAQTADPAGMDRVVTAAYDQDGNVVTKTLTGGGVTQTQTMTYNAMDQQLSQTVNNTGGNLTTSYVRDKRGLVTSETDPAGNTTTIANDEAGRPVVTTGPAVPTQDGTGGTPVTAHPITTTGYDAFGDRVESTDAKGDTTTYAYDQDGQQVSSTDPSYFLPGSMTPVNGTTTSVYNALGEETSTTDPTGNVTGETYDQLGNVATETDPGGGVTTYTHDFAGEQLNVTDPTGAQTQSTYDELGRLKTTTNLVRQNTSAAYTTTYAYNDAGQRISQTSPTGVQVTAAYDALGEQISSTDGAGNVTTYAYDLDGNPTKTTVPGGTATTTTYDLAGRPTSTADLDASGTVLRTASTAYDNDGNVTSATDYLGHTTTSSYDATGMLTSETEPVSATHSITVSFQYDLNGNQAALTDGNGRTTYTTYNSRSLPETLTEPTTAAYSTTGDSTTQDSYDANGDLVTQKLPGGVQISNSYDALGDLTGQSGTGASAATATRGFTYDSAGRELTSTTSAVGTSGTAGYQPATSETFTWDDRGQLLSAAGSAGTSVFTYNGSNQLTSAAEAAGTSSYTYDTAGRLATDADAASGVTGTYSYNNLDQVTQVSYGTGKDTQSFGYDNLHRLTSDTLATSGGAQVASIGYGWDLNNDVASMTTSGLATAGGGTGTVTNTYGYDQAGRLTSWTATPSGGSATTKNYGYDDAGNLTNFNGITYNYDARNELTSDNTNNYAYTADGDLATSTPISSGSASTYSSDAYGQQVTDAGSSFAYDANDRLLTDVNQAGATLTLTYDGITDQVATDPSTSYSRDPAGRITGVSTAGVKLLALSNQHEDLSGTYTATGTALTGSTSYDPWGQVLASSGPGIQVGYQGQWTDPGTGQVSMGARFYKPGQGSFIDQDTYIAPQGGPAVVGNLHAYAHDNPMTITDVSGHSPSASAATGNVSASQVTAAATRAAEARGKAIALKGEAETAAGLAATAAATSHSAAALAHTLNSAAAKAAQASAKATQAAANAFKAAAAQAQTVKEWQDKANAEAREAKDELSKAHSWNLIGDADHAKNAVVDGGIALWDEGRAGAAGVEYLKLEGEAYALKTAALIADGLSHVAAGLAKGAAKAAELAGKLADAAVNSAKSLAAQAAQAAATAAQYQAEAGALARALTKEVAHKIGRAVRAVGRVVKKAAKKLGRVAVAVGKAAYKYSGAQDVVSCVTNPTLAGCVKAAITVALVVGTAGEGEVAEIGLNAAEHVGEDVAENVGAHVTEDAGANAGETYYRTMSSGDYASLSESGRLPASATGETFISPTESFSANYEGTMVKFTVRSGTTDSLISMGARDTSKLTESAFPDMPEVGKGWMSTSAYFKAEGNQINIGLGRGPALSTFNDAITSFVAVPK